MKLTIVLGVVLTCVWKMSSASDGVILMDPFDPQKLGGVWHIYQRNQNLMLSSGGANCLKVDIEHDSSRNDVYKIVAAWKDTSNDVTNVTLYVVDDKSHPAQYFFETDQHRIALSVLGTDYDNWLVAYGLLGLRDTYFIAFREIPVQDVYLAEVKKILDKNMVTKEFLTLDHSSC